MASLKPQALPYTKKGIFGNVSQQGFTGIGAKVGQSVSGLWSNLSAGIASNLLNRSLGLSNEEAARMTADAHASASSVQQHAVLGAGTNISAGGVIPDASKMGEKTTDRQKELANTEPSTSGNDPTLIDDELETLYSRFQRTQHDTPTEDGVNQLPGSDGKARKMRAEEDKVRALNRNGRVDYSIQEFVPPSPITTIPRLLMADCTSV